MQLRLARAVGLYFEFVSIELCSLYLVCGFLTEVSVTSSVHGYGVQGLIVAEALMVLQNTWVGLYQPC